MALRPLAVLVFTAAQLAWTPPSAGQDDTIGVYATGQTLTDGCRAFLRFRQTKMVASAQDAFYAGECYGYVVGVLDKTNVDAGTNISAADGVKPAFCADPKVNANDVVEVFARYLDEHPEKRALGAYFLVRRALGDAFPCG